MNRREVDSIYMVELECLGYSRVRKDLEEKNHRGESLRLFGQFIEPSRYGCNPQAAVNIRGFETAQLLECTSTAFIKDQIEAEEIDKDIVNRVKRFHETNPDNLEFGNAVNEAVKFVKAKKSKSSSSSSR